VSTLRVVLRTRCGCSRIGEAPMAAPPPPEWRLALDAKTMDVRSVADDPFEVARAQVRTFRLQRTGRDFDGAPAAFYLEEDCECR